MSDEPENLDPHVALYINIRDWIQKKNEEHAALLAPKKAAMEQIEGLLQVHMDKTGQIRGACNSGTFYTSTKYTVSIKDKQEFTRHVIGTENWDLVDWKCNVKAARDFEKENAAPLPGVAISAIAKVHVRRPGAEREED